jgi:hypothetical protein
MNKALLSLFAAAVIAPAQPFEFWPGAQYDPAIPSIEKVLGFPPGEKHATAADIGKYFEALAAAAPSRMKIFDYGKTWEGRRLFYAAISSEANIRKLDEIKAGMKKLSDPRVTGAAAAKPLIESLPAVISLAYGVHGNEISSPDAAMMTAYHLLAARNDKLVAEAMANVVVLVDPLQNPDGRDRFVFNFEQMRGLEPDPSPVAAERAEPWPGGRSNHYLFDMNRDWFALTQPETRGRVKYMLDWRPLIAVDLHEMGTDSTYFFAPGAAPYNPHLTAEQKEQMIWFGRNNAKWFDKFGYSYFTREVFDEFYPGYGASWPWYYGGMGMTYENASVRGLVVRRSDDTLYTFRESVKRHFVASVATCETAAANRKALLERYYRYQQTAVEEGQKEATKEYILARQGDVTAVDKLAHLLVEHGVEVKQASAAFKNAGREFPAGSYVVTAAQPRKRFIRAVLEPNIPMEPSFLAEQERRRKKKLPDQIYDVTGWSLPLLFNVECVSAAEASAGGFKPVTGVYQPKGSVTGRAEVAYLVPWGTQAAGRFLTAALREGLRVQTGQKEFTQAGRKYPSGTLIVQVQQNPASVHETVAKLAAATGAEVVATNSSWVDEGINFGSNYVVTLKKPAVALLWDEPTSSLAAGATRFVLERQYGYPVTAVRASTLGRADLSKFHVIILPPGGFGGFGQAMSAAVVDRLKTWVRNGGTLVAVGSALSFLTSPQVGLLATQQEGLAREAAPAAAGRPAEAAKPPTGGAAQQPAAGAAAGGPAPGPAPGKLLTSDAEYEQAIRPDNPLPDPLAGVIVRAKVDPDQWITAGLPEKINVLFDGRGIYSPLKQDRGVNAIVFSAPGDVLASGYAWEDTRKQLALKPFLMLQNEGRGVVAAFTADPNFRAFMDGLNVVFLNAVFRGPAYAGRGGPGEME